MQQISLKKHKKSFLKILWLHSNYIAYSSDGGTEQWCTNMKFYRLSDIEIHIIANTDNQSGVYIYQNSTGI